MLNTYCYRPGTGLALHVRDLEQGSENYYLSCCLSLYGLRAKCGFYIFFNGGGKKTKEEEYFITHENYTEFKFQGP